MMNTDSLSFALNAVTNLVNHSLNRKHYKAQFADLQQFIADFGFEAERHVYRCLFTSILTTYSDTNRLSLLQQLYVDLGSVFIRPNFATLVHYALKKEPSLDPSEGEAGPGPGETQLPSVGPADGHSNRGLVTRVLDLVKCLKLSETEKLALFVCFNDLRSCEREVDLSKCQFSTSSELTHHLLTQLYNNSDLKAKELGKRVKEELNVRFPSDKKESSVAFLHSPFSDSLAMESIVPTSASSLSDDQITAMLVNESGVQLSSEVVRQFNVTPKLCAKLLFALCENNRPEATSISGRSLTEDIDALANICREFLPSASPLMDIIKAIDSESFLSINHKIFSVKSFGKIVQSFNKFWHFCINLSSTDKQGVSILGAMFFGKLWNCNIEFQLGFVGTCVKNQLVSKLLSVGPAGPGPGGGQEMGQLVPHLESLKCQPDFDTNAEISTWKYQKLYQILIDLSIVGSNNQPNQSVFGSAFYSQVAELVKWPLQHCSDLLTLGLLGVTSGPCGPKNDFLTMAIPTFLGNHPNAAIVLHTIWSSGNTEALTNPAPNQWAKQVLLQSMCDYYMKSSPDEQQQRLSRILDVAQDLKALSLLLNSNCYPFVIDLACLASRREYLKLDKWLMDKTQSNGEPFINASVSFLNRRCTALLNGNKGLDPSSALVSNLPSETLATMLACLHQFIVSSAGGGPGATSTAPISQDLSETILTMVANSSLLLQKVPRQPPPGVISNPAAAKAAQAAPTQAIGDIGLSSLSISSQPTPSAFSQTRVPFGGPVTPVGSVPVTQASIPGGAAPGSNPNQQPDRLRQVVGDLANIFPDMQQTVSPEIEKEADTYFQKIYNQSSAGSMSIDDVLEMLRRFQDSPAKREREVFTCMIRNLFKEYCYFPQYPDKELLITAQLFGGIIQMGLVKYMALVVALRYVLEALRKPFNTKMYYFGIAALDRFKSKLKDYPLYCQHLASIPHFRDFPPHLTEYIEYGAQSQEPPNRPGGHSVNLVSPSSPPLSGGISGQMNSVFGAPLPTSLGPAPSPIGPTSQAMAVTANQVVPTAAKVSSASGTVSISSSSSSVTPTTSTSARPSIANATNIDTLLAAGETMYQTPPEQVQDKVAFIINNLSQMNIPQKSDEFKEVIGKDEIYFGWIAQYFVMKRASIEPNFHTLYANFIEMLKLNDLTRLSIMETYRNIKVLLRSDKEIANFSDRSLLKNLGHWLGMLTLSKNKPILALDLNVKNLLIEAYHKGTQELLYVVPFIAKILESCGKSRVFKPQNPWTMGILKALVELHQEPNLKLNLKFEVEVLCKALNQDINELIGTTTVLHDQEVAARVMREQQLGSLGSRVLAAPAAPQPPPQSMPMPPPSLVQSSHPGIPHLPIPSISDPGNSVATGASFFPIPSQPSPPSHPSFVLQPNVPIPPVSPGIHPYNYHDINVSSIAGLSQHVVVQNSQLFQMNPALKQFIRPALERAVQEWLQPVVERSIKISLTTAEQIIKKDFALESDEGKMCLAAHYLIRNLTAGMAMITCKETLFVTITTALIAGFSRNCGPNVPKDVIEQAANSIASDNIDLACCFIQKTAVEKAIPELDKRLASDYESRRKARAEGRRYCDPGTLTYQAERMPETIRLKVGSVTPSQFQVYEHLGKDIPGFVSPVSDPPSIGTVSVPALVASGPVLAPGGGGLPSISNPGFGPNISKTQPGGPMPPIIPPQVFNSSDPNAAPVDSGLVNLYDKLVAELEQLLQQFVANMQPNILINTMHSILETVVAARNNPRDIVGALSLIQRVLDALGELILSADGLVDMMLLTRARDLYLVIMKALADQRAYGHQWTTKQITRLVLERLMNQSSPSPLPDDLFDILMRSGLINLILMDHNLAQMIESAQNPVALAFTLQFVKIYGQAGLHEGEIPNMVSALLKLSKTAGPSNPLAVEVQQILEVFRGTTGPQQPEPGLFMPAVPASTRTSGAVIPGDFESDPPEFMDKTERLLREWISMYHSTTNLPKVFQMYVQSMNHHGILKTDDSITRFFRLSTELCVEFCYRILVSSQQGQSQTHQATIETRSKCFQYLDAFAHLIVMLVKHSGSNTGVASESTAKLNLLNKVLGIIAGVAIQDQEGRSENFQHLPYYRIFIILFMELTLGPNNLGLPSLNVLQMGLGMPHTIDPLYESIQFQVLSAFCQTLRILRPSKAPSFAYAWLDFISHRTFMEKCLNGGNGMGSGVSTKGWTLYAQLLMEIIKFLSPFLRSVELSAPIDLLYKGTLKVLLVLLHDFPEFLCEYCYELCDTIPCNAIQMRNLVLSAFPRNMRLPDPFTPNLKIDSLPEITQTPKGTTSTLAALVNVPFKKDLESYLRTRSPVTFLSELRGYLQVNGQSQQVDTTRYNIPLMNALVLYVGQAAINTITPKHINMTTIAHSSHMDIFQNLAVDLDTEGRYLFLNAIANQLRYPNSYTHYFSCTLLYLFAETNTEAIQEQITRVLLERLIVNRPHPWGLLVTFIELIKNPAFKFWNHEFVRCAPEIEKLFESVARSCMQNQPKGQGPGVSSHVSAEALAGGLNQAV